MRSALPRRLLFTWALALGACTPEGLGRGTEKRSDGCLVTGLVDQRRWGLRKQFVDFLSSVTAVRVCDISTDRALWFDETRGVNSRPVLVSGGHGASRHWALPNDSFWLGEVAPAQGTSTVGEHHPLTVGRGVAATRAAFLCACQVMGAGEKSSFFDPPQGDFDYYDVNGSIIEEARPGLGSGLIGVCGFSTYLSCDLLADARPFDRTAWRGADAFESFMAAGIVSKPWPLVPVCIIRHAGSGRPQSVADLDGFAAASAAGTEWLVRYVDWERRYPSPLPPKQLFRLMLDPARPQDRPAPGGTPPEEALVQRARRELAVHKSDTQWHGPAAVGKVRVRDASGKETTEPDTVVVIRPQDGAVQRLDVHPGLVWYGPDGTVKFVGGGGPARMPEPRSMSIEREADFFPAAARLLGCRPDAPRQVATGRSRSVPEPLALVECAATNDMGQSYLVGGAFRVPELK